MEILLDGEKIGSYRRNYSSLFDTCVPFFLDGRVYALYSRDYTSTRLMRLPECEDIGGEEPHQDGFCPTSYYVPYDPAKGLLGRWGFICGCIWGDDTSWKIEYLDFSQAAEGILKREARFGYLELASNLTLREAVNLAGYNEDDEYGEIEFTVRRVYFMKEGTFEKRG